MTNENDDPQRGAQTSLQDGRRRDRSHSRPRNQQRTRSRSKNSRHPSHTDNNCQRDSVKAGEVKKLVDPNLSKIDDDPRSREVTGKVMTGFRGGGRNTESFDPASTLCRPDMRIIVGPKREVLGRSIKHDDIVVVPEFVCDEADWSMYYKLVEEMREVQARGEKGSEWISWHEGAHLISKNPKSSKTFQMIQDKISRYFDIPQKSVGTRFNWYKDSSDWKPFHHDSAAFNPQRARTQNITVGISLGATRELAFLHAKSGTKVYFPQTNGMMFSFGRDVNIQWKHGVNALSTDEQIEDGRGRVSIILWGMCGCTKEETDSPPMLSDNTRGNGHSLHGPRNNGDRDRDRSREREREREREGRGQDRGRSRSRSRSRDRRSRDRERERERGREACRDFSRGRCNHGDSCRFSHSR